MAPETIHVYGYCPMCRMYQDQEWTPRQAEAVKNVEAGTFWSWCPKCKFYPVSYRERQPGEVIWGKGGRLVFDGKPTIYRAARMGRPKAPCHDLGVGGG